MISIREKDESYDGKIRKMLVEAVEGITVSDEIKLRIQKRIGDENDPRNKAVRQNEMIQVARQVKRMNICSYPRRGCSLLQFLYLL